MSIETTKKRENNLISLIVIILIVVLGFLINQKIQKSPPMPILEEQSKEQQENILEEINKDEKQDEKQQDEKQYENKNELPIGAIITIVKIQLADLKLTEAEYATKKTQLIQDFNLKELKIDDKERFVAMLNIEISKWKEANKQEFIMTNVNENNLINKIIEKISI